MSVIMHSARYRHSNGLVGDTALAPVVLSDSSISGNTGEKLRVLTRDDTSPPACFAALPATSRPALAPSKDILSDNVD